MSDDRDRAIAALVAKVGPLVEFDDGMTVEPSSTRDARGIAVLIYRDRFAVAFGGWRVTVTTRPRETAKGELRAEIVGLEIDQNTSDRGDDEALGDYLARVNSPAPIGKRALHGFPTVELETVAAALYGEMYARHPELRARAVGVSSFVTRRREPIRKGAKVGDHHYRDVAEFARHAADEYYRQSRRLGRRLATGDLPNVTERIVAAFKYSNEDKPSLYTVAKWLDECRSRGYLGPRELKARAEGRWHGSDEPAPDLVDVPPELQFSTKIDKNERQADK